MGSGETFYRSSNGRYYRDSEIWSQFESGQWLPYCWDAETGAEWIQTDDGEIIELTPISPPDCPYDAVLGHTVDS
jgi:hypothetical protein